MSAGSSCADQRSVPHHALYHGLRTVSIPTGGIFVNNKAGTSKAGLFCGARSIAIATLTVFFAVAAGPALGSTRGDGNEPGKKAATATDAGKPVAGDKTSSDSNSAD